MSPGNHTENKFELAVYALVQEQGWAEFNKNHWNPTLGLNTGELFQFIGATQNDEWEDLKQRYGGDPNVAQRLFAQRVAAEIDGRGVLDVLRHGVKDRGVRIDLAYFRPGHTLAPAALAAYEANVLTVVRQLHHSAKHPGQSVDMALFVNGIPTASVEFKNPMTGQGAEKEAIEQYRKRDVNDLFFARRAVVHFAVDPDRAFVATKLTGATTRFLPFNVGTNGPGESGGAGNPTPSSADQYAVSYLWTDIWQRDNWLEILQRYLHIDAGDGGGTKTKKANPHTAARIFPRFHQWHAVQTMVADARAHGAGRNYLIQHSAGSGKSNTIAWLAHRLSNLFDAGNEPVFHKTVVITDRTVLDRQLQNTIFQFDHTPGVVTKIDQDSTQLAKALSDSTSKIVISTLQMYPFVLDKLADTDLRGHRYAVIIDEAHSSQGGEASARMKQVLGVNSVRRDDEDEATYRTRVRGKQANLSYFAFTATPKAGTLNLFGREDVHQKDPETGRAKHAPFHVYSMRQAIEEGYILDVLANYITYETKWRLRNEAVDAQERARLADPEVDERKAKAALVRFAQRHPTATAQKAKLIVEDFRDNVAPRLGGRAKAMVVTGSRQAALDLYQAIRKQRDTIWPGLGVLVAFSGPLKDPDTQVERTEAQLNGFPELQLPARFGYVKADDPQAAACDQDEYRLLVVAEKYQTGFDQPLLCGMYVDKKLTDVAAVQTLSRLNRIHPLKSQDDVRVLDFANAAESMEDSFRPWFERTTADEPDPNLLYRLQQEVMGHAVLAVEEMEAFVAAAGEAPAGTQSDAAEKALHARLHQYLQPAIDRYEHDLDPDGQKEFRDQLNRYVRAYSLYAQVLDWGDPELEVLYQYGRLLLLRLPVDRPPAVDIGEADLSHFRLQHTGDHDVSLTEAGDQTVRGHADGGGGPQEPETALLSEIIAELNDRFGLDLGTSDEILVIQQVVGLVEDPGVNQVGLMNDEERFRQVADGRLDDIVAENAERNTDFMKLYFDNDEFREAIKAAATRRAYRIITAPARDDALAKLRAEMNRATGGDG